MQRELFVGSHTFAPAKLFHSLSSVGYIWDIGLLTDETQLTNDLADCDCIFTSFCLHCMTAFEPVIASEGHGDCAA